MMLWLGMLLAGVPLTAQKYSNEFLSIGVGARAQGMGGAVVASINDVTAGAWNPAGLSRLPSEPGLQLGAMHSEWFGGVGKYDYLAITLPIADQQKRLGISLIRFGVDNIPNTLSLYESDGTINYDNVRAFSEADYALLLSYAQPWKNTNGQLLVGGNLKIVHRKIGPFATSWGFGIDLGTQLRSGAWQFGLLAKDITTTFNAWSFSFTDEQKEVLGITGNEIPINSVEITAPQLLLGVARKIDFGKIGLLPELDLIATTDGKRNTLLSAKPVSIDLAVGLEADYDNFLFVRGGVSQFQRVPNFDGATTTMVRPSIGVGLKISSLHIDYAFTNPGDGQNRYSHILSLILEVKPKRAIK